MDTKDPRWTTLMVLFTINFIIGVVVLIPIEIYYLIKFWKHRYSPIINKRYPSLVLIITILIICYSAADFSYDLVCSIYRDHEMKPLIDIIIQLIQSFCVALYFARLWLLFYEINLNVEVIQNKWQSIIDDAISEKHWYLRHKHTFGNWKKILFISLIYASLWMIAFRNPWFALPTPLTTAIQLILWCPMGILWVLMYKTSEIHDRVGLRWEFAWSGSLATLFGLILSVIWLLRFTRIPDREQDYFGYVVTHAALQLLRRLMGFMMSMISIYRVWAKFQLLFESDMPDPSVVGLIHQKTLEELKEEEQQNKNERLKIKQALKDDKSFDLFVTHCGDEHCLECILSLIEFIQFKRKIYGIMMSNGNDNIFWDERLLDLPHSCPMSTIVNSDDDLKRIARLLYLKYIHTESEWEINISFIERRRLSTIMDDEDNWMNNTHFESNQALYSIFDSCIEAMLCLLRAAFSRYKTSDQFLLLKKKQLKTAEESIEQSM